MLRKKPALPIVYLKILNRTKQFNAVNGNDKWGGAYGLDVETQPQDAKGQSSSPGQDYLHLCPRARQLTLFASVDQNKQNKYQQCWKANLRQTSVLIWGIKFLSDQCYINNIYKNRLYAMNGLNGFSLAAFTAVVNGNKANEQR